MAETNIFNNPNPYQSTTTPTVTIPKQSLPGVNTQGNDFVNLSTGTSTTGTSTTTTSNIPKQEQAKAIQDKNAQLTNPANYGISTNANGGTQYANGTAYTPPQDNSAQIKQVQGQLDDANKQLKTLQEGIANGTMDENGNAIIKPVQASTYVDYQGNTVAMPSDNTIPPGVTLTPDGKGNYIGSDGKRYKAPTGDTSYDNQQITNNLAQIKQNSDAAMASAIDGIQKNYDNYIQQQQETNRGQQAGVQNALLMGNALGQGSSSQYAPISSSGIMTAQINYGQQQITKLQNERDSLISQAKLADYSTAAGNKALDAINSQLEQNRTEQINAATKLNDLISTQNQKLADAKQQSARDNSIANLISPTDGSAGLTDPAKILGALKAGGDTTTTLKDITDTLTSIANTNNTDVKTLSGDVKNFEALKAMGGLPGSITSLPQDQQLAAYISLVHGAAAQGTTSGKATGTPTKVGGTGSGTSSSGASPATADQTTWLSEFYASGGNQVLPALGMGNVAVGLKMGILKGIADYNMQLGISGSDFAAISKDKNAATKALNTISNNQGMMAVAEGTASKNFDQILANLDAQGLQSVSPFLNQFIQTGKIQTGNTKLKPLANLITTSLNEYAKVITGQTTGAGVSDAARREAQAMMSVADNPETIKNFIAMAKQEMGNRVSSYKEAKDHIFGLIQNPTGEVNNIQSSNAQDFINNPIPSSASSTTNPTDFWANAK